MPPRCFLALTLPDRFLAALATARETLTALAPGWAGEKWVAPGLLHVTVAFLGDLDDRTLATTLRAFEAAAASSPAFELIPDGVRGVPSTQRATMLWATLADPEGHLETLRAGLTAVLPDAIEEAPKPLRPHVTLVRARAPRRIAAAAIGAASAGVVAAGKDPDGVVSVRSVTLYSSTLRPSGPEYREIAAFRLAR